MGETTGLGESEYVSLKWQWKRLYVYLAYLRMREAAAYILLQLLLGTAFKLQKYMPKTEYNTVSDGETIDINWRDREALSLSCCDCGLIHYVRFFATSKNIRMKLWRNDEATDRHREERGISVDYE